MADIQSEGVKAINLDEHNDDAHAKRVIIRYQDPADGEWYNYNPHTSLAERYDYSSSTTIYTAVGPVGTADNAAGWTITKYDLTDSSDASGKIATAAVWDDRASETYL